MSEKHHVLGEDPDSKSTSAIDMIKQPLATNHLSTFLASTVSSAGKDGCELYFREFLTMGFLLCPILPP